MPTDVQRIQAVFLAAAQIADPANRARFLDGACDGDTELRARVEALLRAHDQPDSLLDHPAAVAPGPDPGATEALNGTSGPGPVRTAPRTVGGENGSSDDEALAFLAPPQRPDSLGRIGHYEVLQVLGRGGFGIVFRAFDEVLQRVVALKVMSPQLAATSPARKRFLREARSSAQVRHEYVVQVYEVAEQPLPYLAMEFIPGETLQHWLDRVGPVEPAEVVGVGRQIAEGLAAAHATDLIHRDIKPANVLLEGGQRVKITDFGLARAADDASISQSGIIAGTPMYMAPEQAKGERLDQRADLFSLGSVLYQMAAGRPPFRANSTVAVLKRVAEDTPRDIREITPETPQWLCDIIAKLHAKNPDDRYQSAREVADVLADCEAQLKANARLKDYSRIPRSKSRQSGRRKWAAVAAAVLLPVIALAMTEFAGVTHLVQKYAPTVALTPKVDPEGTPKSGRNAEQKTPIATGSFALAFDGKSSVVDIPSLRVNEDHALTVEVWAVLEQPADQRQNYNLVGNPNVGGFVLNADAKTGRNAFAIRLKNPDMYVAAKEKEPVPRNQLVHFAGVYDGKAEIRFYVNGQFQTRHPAGNIKPSSAHLRLGNNDQRNWGFLGRMNEVRLSKVARYDTDFTPAKRWEPDKDTIALYQFDEGEGSVLKDSSGNGHHGEIVGATWVKANGLPIGPPTTEPLPPTFKNSLGMEFVIVPKGKSWLGGGKDRTGDKEVVIPADFYLGKYEVTQEEWEKVMGENPSWFSRTGAGKDAVKDIPDADLKRFPVEMVSWDDCQRFVAKLNEREKETGWVYRLPTETQWEYACRGGSMTDRAESAFDYYPAKPTNALLPEQANFGKDRGSRTCKVASYPPNRLGLYDMHGNVWEWCQDESPGDPKYPKAASWRVNRGGCWYDNGGACQAAYRNRTWPALRNFDRGFRLALVPAGAASPEAKAQPAEPTVHDTLVKEIVLERPEPRSYPFPPRLFAKLQEWNPDFDAAFLRAIPGMPAEQQVVMAEAWLRARNPPTFNSAIKHKIEGGVVTSLEVQSPLFRDLTAVRGLTGLRSFTAQSTLGYDNRAESDAAVLRSLGNLETINGKPVAEFWKDVEAKRAEFREWLQQVPKLPPEQQVAAVFARMKERNPDIRDTKAKHKIEGGVVTELEVTHDNFHTTVTDLEPVRALTGLTSLRLPNCYGLEDLEPLRGMKLTRLRLSNPSQDIFVRDLEPLRGMKLTELHLGICEIRDLEPLRGMPLRCLTLTLGQFKDLTPLKDMPLEVLDLHECTRIDDLAPLKGMPLRRLGVAFSQVKDLTALKDMPLVDLNLSGVPVQNLEPLKGMPLKVLSILKTEVTDLRPLQGMELTEIALNPGKITQGMEVLRDMKSLKTFDIGLRMPRTSPPVPQLLTPEEFWERYDKGK